MPNHPPGDGIIGTPVPLAETSRVRVQGNYVAAGIGLRGVGSGAISIDVPAGSTILGALLYWAAMGEASTPGLASGTFNDVSITGTLLGSTTSPCWTPSLIFNFRADVSSLVVNGTNTVSLASGGGGAPLLEGASLVVVYSNPAASLKEIIIQDGAVTLGAPPPVTTVFGPFDAFGASSQARTTWIVADGQPLSFGNGSILDNRTLVNGTQLADFVLNGAGPGTPYWDTLTNDISAFIPPGTTSVQLAIESTTNDTGASDCLTWVAQVLSVDAVNQPPFFDPLADQFSSMAVNVDQTVSITGVAAGPAGEVAAGQTVTLTATSDNPALIPDPTISGNPTEDNPAGNGSTRTLTWHRASTANGTATITVTAKNTGGTAGGGTDTFSRTFDITLGTGAAGAVNATVTNVNLTGGPLVTVSVTFAPIDFDGDGNPDCYSVFPPTPYNVILTNANQIPEGPPISVPGDLAQVCGSAQTFNTTIDLSQWDTTPGSSVDFTYVNHVRDPELETSGTCTTTCSDRIWTGEKPAGSVTFTPGDTVGVKTTVTLKTLDLVTKHTTSTRLAGIPVRDFDIFNHDFQVAAGMAIRSVFGDSPTSIFSFFSTLLGQIFDADKGQVGTCVTDATGVCFAGQPAPKWDLGIVKFFDADTGLTVYAGDVKRPRDFVHGIATENIVITKLFKKGVFQGYTSSAWMFVRGRR